MAMHNPPHPGGIVKRQCLEPLGLTVTRAAEGLGVTRQALSELVNERTGVSVEMAIRLSKAFGSTPGDLAGDADGLRSLAGPRPRPGDRGRALCAGVKPKLLSGGNPQIPKGDGDAPVQAYIAAMPGWKREVGGYLDALIERSVPNVRKAVRWNTPFYGIEDQGWFLAFHCFTRYVKVTFLNGASLRPVPPVESRQEDVRYFHIHEDDELDEDRLVSWLKQASALRGEEVF